jgi:hypothetical protein
MFFKKKPFKVFFQDHNNVLAEVKRNFIPATTIQEADRVVVWNDVNTTERGILNYAKSLRKKTIAVQHGRKGTSKYYHPFYEEITADKLLVWGEFDKKRLIANQHPEKKIVVCGNTVLRNFEFLKREPHEGINIVFSPEHWDREVSENEKTAKILNLAARENGWNITTKIIDGHDPKIYRNPVYSDRNSPEHFTIIAQVLATADLVVGISESTFELIAQYIDIPVVIVNEWYAKSYNGDKRYETYERLISEASAQATFDNLVEVIKEQLANPLRLQAQRKQACEQEGGTNIQNPLVKICEEIRK